MIAIKPYRQKPGYCGPASLKMVLDFYGTRLSEDDLAELSGATNKHGATADGIKSAAEQSGFQVFIKDDATFADIASYLERQIPVIVDWFSTDDGHYSVVVGLDSDNIYLQDPELGGLRTLDRETFFRIWFDFPENFLKTKDDLILRRMIVIMAKNSS